MLTRLATIGLLALSFAALAQPGGGVDAEDPHADPRDLLPMVKIGLTAAIEAAERASPGRAVEAELIGLGEGAQRRAVYDIDVLADDGAIFDVRVSALTGAVESSARDLDDDDEEEAAAFRRVLRHSRLTLAELLAEAGRIVHGTPVSAEFDAEDGPECDIVVAVGAYLVEIGFDAGSGRLIELELVPDWGHADDDDDEDDDD